MNTNSSIKIAQVSNGFMVEPDVGPNHCSPLTDTAVFQSMEELISFLELHFEFRCSILAADSSDNKLVVE